MGSSAATRTIGKRWQPEPKPTRCCSACSAWGGDVSSDEGRFQGARDWAADCPLRSEEYRKMPLINLIVPLIVIGIVLWLINNYIPMASSIKRILNVVVVVIVAVWVLQAVGLWSPITNYRLHMR